MTDVRVYLDALFAPYTDPRALLAEIRPCYPSWKHAAVHLGKPVEDGWEFRTPPGTRNWFMLTPSGLDKAAAHIATLAPDYDVYIGVCPRNERRGGAAFVPTATTLWLDIDGGDEGYEGSVALLKAALRKYDWLYPPHLTICSGGGMHAYWRLVAPEPLVTAAEKDHFKQVLRRLCTLIGTPPQPTFPDARAGVDALKTPVKISVPHADTHRADIASILRPPQTINWKREHEPRAVRMTRYVPEQPAHDLAWWDYRLPRPPRVEYAPSPVLPSGKRPIPPRTQMLLAQPMPVGSRHNACERLIVSMRKCGYDEMDLHDMGMRFCALNQFPEGEMRYIVRWVCRTVSPEG